MNTFICFIRGGTADRNNQTQAKKNWKKWIDNLAKDNCLLDNGTLTTNGKIVADNGHDVRTFHFNLDANASGYIILEAKDLEHAVALTQDCPVFMYGGNVTIRPIVGKYSTS